MLGMRDGIVMANIDCQFDGIQNILGDKPQGTAMMGYTDQLSLWDCLLKIKNLG